MKYQTERDYPNCSFCGGEVRFARVTRTLRWRGQLYLIENAPVGVCHQCGERYVTTADALELEKLLKTGLPPDHMVEIPAYVMHDPIEVT
jgi:YgiT-type zinc finger domain-containing protein